MDNRKTEFSDLPSEVVCNHVIPFLPGKTIHTAMTVSRSWLGLFNSPGAWMMRIEKDYQIPTDTLQSLAGYFKKITDRNIDYRLLYNQLHHLRKIEYHLPKYIKFSYRDASYHLQVLTCCLDSEAFALHMLVPAEDEMWITLALYAGFNNVALLMKRHERIEQYLVLALQAGNLTFVRDVFSENLLEILNSTKILNAAVSSGNLPLVEWLVRKFGDEGEFDVDTFPAAVSSGNMQMVEYVFSSALFNEKYADDEQIFDEQTLKMALRSGSCEVVEWVSKKFDLVFYPEDIIDAAASGALPLVKHMEEKFKLAPSKEATYEAAKSGNLELFLYLLDKTDSDFVENKENYKLKVKKSDSIEDLYSILSLNELKKYLYGAVLSGNSELVEFCQEKLHLDLLDKWNPEARLNSFNHHACLVSHAVASNNILLTEKLRQQIRVSSSHVIFLLSRNYAEFCTEGYFPVIARTQQCFSATFAKENYDGFLLNIKDVELESVLYSIIALADMLRHPQEFSLNINSAEVIVQNISHIATLRELSIIENIQIRSQLKNACSALWDQGYLNLASNLEELSNQLAKKNCSLIEDNETFSQRKLYF